jgi:hypothetical protein
MPSKIDRTSFAQIDEHLKETSLLGDACSGKKTTKGNFHSEDKRDLKLIVLTLLFTNAFQLRSQICDSVEQSSNWTEKWPLILLMALQGIFLLFLSSDNRISVSHPTYNFCAKFFVFGNIGVALWDIVRYFLFKKTYYG